ncbi:transcriptional regulator, TetR family [Desulfatibacillum alkenivorans DSM 16219]|jgi:AcrR family transcriptional regulator|uniref:Transcriptional regulator, TetR family n=1 Tax=Desulfatibacillum alkenivorans DSM 16219 TaxID=1121393 RepID=A0A1M6Z3Y3_9BACT|nr:TetR/AcrR family transcriptional regulator [Desulfatibacillum alkenivorans]SHL25077.1 transcriptional regulator, TetR family [Desulfatibacillum alkenivorans DSM 16219]
MGASQKKGAGKAGVNRKEKVLEAARSLFFEKGYRGATVEQIAKRAGFSKRTVYLDFKNKDDLFISVCAQGMEILVREMETIPTGKMSTDDFVDAFLDVLTRFSKEHEKYLHMFTVEATPDLVANCSEEVRSRVTQLEQAGYGIVVAQIEKGLQGKTYPDFDPMEAAGIFLGAVTGVILLSLGGSQTIFSRETLESMAKRAGRLLLRGLANPEKRKLWLWGGKR